MAHEFADPYGNREVVEGLREDYLKFAASPDWRTFVANEVAKVQKDIPGILPQMVVDWANQHESKKP